MGTGGRLVVHVISLLQFKSRENSFRFAMKKQEYEDTSLALRYMFVYVLLFDGSSFIHSPTNINKYAKMCERKSGKPKTSFWGSTNTLQNHENNPTIMASLTIHRVTEPVLDDR